MRLSKRQLKRIIREEYTRLKRKGLIKEMAGGQDFMAQGGIRATDLFADFCDAVDSLYDDDPSWTTNTLGYLWEQDIEEVSAMHDEEGDSADSNAYVEDLFRSDDAYGVCDHLLIVNEENGTRENGIVFLINKFMKFAADELGYTTAP